MEKTIAIETCMVGFSIEHANLLCLRLKEENFASHSMKNHTGRVCATRPLRTRLSIASISSMVDVIVAQYLRTPCLENEG